MDGQDDAMADEVESETLAEIPRKIFEQLIQKLTDAGANADTVARLKKTILDDGSLSDKAIRAALFPPDQQSP